MGLAKGPEVITMTTAARNKKRKRQDGSPLRDAERGPTYLTCGTFVRDDLKPSCHRSCVNWALGDPATRLCLLTLSFSLNGLMVTGLDPAFVATRATSSVVG